MKHSHILATSWLIGFPVIVMFVVSHYVFSLNLTPLGFLKEYKNKSNSEIKEIKLVPRDCRDAKINELKNSSAESVMIDCNLTLDKDYVYTKRMIFEGAAASNVTLNCNGATIDSGKNKDMIEVRSRSYLDGKVRKWERPANISIKNCNIIGSVRIWGMAQNGEGTGSKYADSIYKNRKIDIHYFWKSSRTRNHVKTARDNAPTNIILDNITITGIGRNPLYFAPGVTYSKLINSEVKGVSDANAIYLDAESYRNVIENNYIHTVTKNKKFERWDRPLIAIDGSSYNLIINNTFSALNHGGIYLYRNCGKAGVIRHSTPSYNQIINNIFKYNHYDGDNPAIYIGAKDADLTLTGIGPIGFCNDDDGYEFGSSKSDLDLARYNVVMQNQIYKRSVKDMIVNKNPEIKWPVRIQVNSPNFIAYNESVEIEKVRPYAGCYVANGYKKNFVTHEKSIELFKNKNGEPFCGGYQFTCYNSELKPSGNSTCVVRKQNFHCSATGNNNGCYKNISIPNGKRIIGVKAVCNLESPTISDKDLQSVSVNKIKVIKPSDNNWNRSNCFINNINLINGNKNLTGVNGSDMRVGCKEHDDNGGDCMIKGIVYYY